ncbi:MAG: hypothetical protein GIKADHBN_00127 [Phycisphaerales bacterium]|nr:hypothetical protein [Phycisphaerales bacterium]
MSEQSRSSEPIFSDFADDPDMQELVELFAQEMPAKIEKVRSAFEAGRFDDLRRLAHQLKGAAGGYGFGVVGDAAGRLEEHLATSAAGSAGSIEQIKKDVQALLDLCRNVRARG